MQKIIISIFGIIISLSMFASTDIISMCEMNQLYYPIRKKDSIKSDTIYNAKRMGNEIKMTLNKAGEFGMLINENQVICVKNDGFTGFGTKNPQYRVDVCGSIRASEELIVEANEWCDFVFDEDYCLEPFRERITAIKSNKHLPYIKSEDEILNNGISVSETISGLLRNVEEMYLYIEKLEERISLLEEENRKLSSASND
ncbi:MAG: hypothetical protein PHH30_04995 [Bacteroidales bacterium]|nr:hypothetical protein [Bacteroidales bacterium]MDD3860779.1 hypothetical protein [Bacteroidales bacterium]